MTLGRRFREAFGTGFGIADDVPSIYVECIEESPAKLARGDERYLQFKEEFAAHIRDSSFPPPYEGDTQWMTDEWLRNIWYDAFGPEPLPGDPFPVPHKDWGRRRLADYMIYAVNETPEFNSPGAPAWLEARGLTFADVNAAVELSATQSVGFRSAPEGWLEHLKQLTDRGLREPQPGELPAGGHQA